ncbi:hypothetical protein CPB83DRAFT_853802 [Crepidotus variabilis]|uniref:non-specific serine/threonine protein kinase n=1 Tax=Crepidotus variabilis TaxID=179855 RepID=A0A9P6JQ42_9AGAR|nr:hypothetical protein CPB83DRAFT_853802 [Crepidotus variabilis]
MSTFTVNLDIHRGAIDQGTLTTQPPCQVMERVNSVLEGMGVVIQSESPFRLRCIRAGKPGVPSSPTSSPVDEKPSSFANDHVIYGPATEDPGAELRFTVELTKLSGLETTYSLDIRRLKGNLRSYKFIYDTLRDRAQLKI